MRWLAHRGGALDFRDHALQSPGEPFPIAVALGADPATILGAVTPVPDTLSEYQFAGLLRGSRTEIVKCLSHGLAGAGVRRDRARRLHPPGCGRSHRLRDRARRPVRRSHRLLQRRRALSGVDDRADHDAPRSDLSLDLHRQAARRARGARRRAERSVRAAAAEAVSGDRRLLPAAGRLLVPPRRRRAQEAVSGTRQARDVRRVELPAPVHVHEDHRRHRRRREHPRLEGSDLGAHDARRSGARHAASSSTRRSTTSTSRRRSRASAARWASTRRTSGPARRRAHGAGRSRWTPAVKARVDALWSDLGL